MGFDGDPSSRSVFCVKRIAFYSNISRKGLGWVVRKVERCVCEWENGRWWMVSGVEWNGVIEWIVN